MTRPRLLAAFVVTALALAATPAEAATITVTTNQDEFNTSGGTGAGCSLREAIQAANTDSAFGGCPAGSGADVIDLQGGTTYSIQSISGCTAATTADDTNHCGDFDISSDMTIQGAGAGSTIVNGASIDRVFEVFAPAHVTIAGVTIEGGEPPLTGGNTNLQGGGIRNNTGATLTLNNDDVFENHTDSQPGTNAAPVNGTDGGGIYNTGDLTLNSTTVDHDFIMGAITSGNGGNGGGIANEGAGKLTLNGSTIDDDTAGDAAGMSASGGSGGGIYASGSGSVTISNTTVAGNKAGTSAGSVAGGNGGGLDASGGGTVTISGTTISGNKGGTAPSSGIGGSGGGMFTSAMTTLTNSTIANNTSGGSSSGGYGAGGGLDVQGGTSTLTNDTIAGNALGTGSGLFPPAGGIQNSGTTTLANTIIAAGSAGANCGGTVTDGHHNVSFGEMTNSCPGTFATGNPNLGQLQNNGGPTNTMSVAGPVAVDQVPATGAGCPATDQRSIPRPQGAACDIGAFEVVVPTTLTVSKAGDGSGGVTSSPAGIDCGATCSAQYTQHTSVTLSASPDSGSSFAGWSGPGCSGTGTCTVPMDAETAVTATFTANPFTLLVSKIGTGSGTVTSSPAGIDCGATCSAQFSPGTSVTLTAAPDSGSTFDGWSGGGCSGMAPCTLSLAADTSVSASFSPVTPPPPGSPNTKIGKAKIDQKDNTATFTFKATGTGKRAAASAVKFQCALVKKHRKARFRKCTSPKRYKHLKKGRYTFEVRAFDAAGKDPTPAKHKFRIK